MISTCSNVDLPEPVLPEISTCCEVPLPRSRCCSFMAPARPSGTSMPPRLSAVHHCSGVGAMNSKGTSTRLASRAAAPTRWRIFETSAGSGGASRASGYRPRLGSRELSLLSFQQDIEQLFSISLIWKDNKLNWREPNLGQYPLALDAPPDPALFSKILHRVGAAAATPTASRSRSSSSRPSPTSSGRSARARRWTSRWAAPAPPSSST